MNLAEKYEKETMGLPGYGIQFSIEPNQFECRLGDRISYGESHIFQQHSPRMGYQPVLLDGKPIENAFLITVANHNIFKPIISWHEIMLADCLESEKITNEMRNNEHFADMGEWFSMRFATLNQMLDYLKL